MPDRDARELLIVEAEWHVVAAECRLLLAMRHRAENEDDPGPAPIGRLIGELEEAAGRLRSACGRDVQKPALEPHPGPHAGRSLAVESNGSFTNPLQIGDVDVTECS